VSDKRKICFVNRNYPPEHGATGYHAKRLLDVINEDPALDAFMVSCGTQREYPENIVVDKIYHGGVNWKRLVAALLEGIRLVKKARSKDPDIYVIMTDPSLLSIVASLWLRKKRWVLWSMDLYPEAFVAAGLISSSNPIQKLFKLILRSWPPKHLISLGEQQAKFLRSFYYPDLSYTLLPIGLRSRQYSKESEHNPEWYQSDKLIFGYLGSIGEAHDNKLIKKFIERLNPLKHHMVLSLSGSNADTFSKSISNHIQVTLVDHIPDRHCALIDIQIVSLKPQWTHICVPSKAKSALQFGSAILYFGSAQSDTWHYVKEAGWIIDKDALIEDFLSTLDHMEVNNKRAKANKIAENISSIYVERQSEIVDLLKML
jgi:hypothetical protein